MAWWVVAGACSGHAEQDATTRRRRFARAEVGFAGQRELAVAARSAAGWGVGAGPAAMRPAWRRRRAPATSAQHSGPPGHQAGTSVGWSTVSLSASRYAIGAAPRPAARHLGAAEHVLPRDAGTTPDVPTTPTESRSGPYDRLSRVRMNAACDVRQLKPLFNGLLGDLVDERRHADKTHEFRYPTRSRNSERRTCPYRPKPASGRWCATPTYPAAARRPARCRGPTCRQAARRASLLAAHNPTRQRRASPKGERRPQPAPR